MKTIKVRQLTRRIIVLLLSFVMAITMIPVATWGADANLGELSGASSIDVDVSKHYGHELHTTKVGGNTYPLFCIEYGTTSPSSSYLAGRKEMASSKVLEAARWIFAGYYMEHGNSIDWLDMAYCQKKVWSIMGSEVNWDFTTSGYSSWCSNAEKNMKNLDTYPSFNNKNVGGIIAGESKTISDVNGVLKDYPAFTYNRNGVKIIHSDNSNQITITVDKSCTETSFSILNDTYFKKNTGDDNDLLLYYPNGNASYQKMIYSAYYDPISFSLTGDIEPLGSIQINKESEDNNVSGIQFNIKGEGVNKNVTTGSDGTVKINELIPGTYTVTENAPEKYVQPNSKTVTVRSNQTATVSFDNVLKKFRANVIKTDIEKGEPQGDASLAGAVYGLYKNNQLITTYTTDANGSFTTDYFTCDTDWTIKEISPSEGYLLDTTVYKVGADPKLYTVEYNTAENDVKEQVIKGNISIIKHTDDGSTQIETPEKGAEFQIYLKSAGSFVNADEDERDTIVCDEDGFASSKLLPYGVYTVHQTKCWDGREKIKDFDVFISTDGNTYKFLINNSNFESYLKIVKLDKETGKQIAYEGAGFEIYDSDGRRVSMQFTYPQVTTIHTFYTNSEGYLITPEKLPYGDYTLVEVQAPYGYVLDSTPIPFSINQENSSTDTGVTVVKVKASNLAQKGVIEITKTGEVFASVENSGDVYTPIYEVQGLPGAEIEIYAAEDIVTGDSTVRAVKGELVDTIVTDSNGIAKSKQLYLGKYTIKEITAPETFYNDQTEYAVELTYAGQDVEVSSTSLSVYNQRQLSSASLNKVLEQDNLYSVGMNGEMENVSFSVYAAEDVIAQDGKKVPENGLVTTAFCGNDGNIDFECDLPIGFNWYVQEKTTDEHYIIDEAKYEFSTEYQGQNLKTIDIEINDGNEILNDIITGSVKGIKLDDSGNALEGAVIGIFNSDTENFTADTAVTTTVSNKDGTFSFFNVPYGNYIVREIKAPKNYLLDETSYSVKITDNEQVIEVEIIDVLKRGTIQGVKIDNKSNPLEGALIGLFNSDENQFTKDTAIMVVKSDKNGSFKFNDIPVGKYIVRELRAPNGYILNDNSYEVSITENDQIVEMKIVNEAKNIIDKSPLTGIDNINFIVFMFVCFISALIVCLIKKAKHTKNKAQ